MQIIRAAIAEARRPWRPSRNQRICRSRRAMLIGQASINLSANILSALLGLLSVFVFTRLFSPHDYGIYLLGVGFAAVVSTFPGGLVPQPDPERTRAQRRHRRSGPGDIGIFDLLSGCARRLRIGTSGRTGCHGGNGSGRARGRDRPVRTDPGSGSCAASGLHRHEGDADARAWRPLASARLSRCSARPDSCCCFPRRWPICSRSWSSRGSPGGERS